MQIQVRNEVKSKDLLCIVIYSSSNEKKNVQQYQKCMFSKIQNCSSVLTQDYHTDQKTSLKNIS